MAGRNAVNRRTLIDAIAFIGIGAICLVEGYRLNITADPRALSQRLAPGFYILLLGGILLVTGVVHLVRNLRTRESVVPAAPGQRAAMTVGLAAIVAALAGYAILMNSIGYFVGTTLFFLAILAIFKVRPWPLTVALSLALGAAFYTIFVVYLDIIFPRGLLF